MAVSQAPGTGQIAGSGGVRVLPAGTDGLVQFAPRMPISAPPERNISAKGRWHAQKRRRAEILAKARQLLAEHGCDSVKIRSLAELSGVSPPTIYHIVGGKDDVLTSAIHEALCAKFAWAQRLAAISEINIPRAYALATWMAIDTDPDYYRQVIHALTLPERRELRTKLNTIIRQSIAEWLRDMNRRGELADAPACLDTIGGLIARQMTASITAWAYDEIGLPELRRDLVTGTGLMLDGIVSEALARSNRIWIDRHR